MPQPVSGDLETVLKKGYTPACHYHKNKGFRSHMLKVSIPCVGHKYIGYEKKHKRGKASDQILTPFLFIFCSGRLYIQIIQNGYIKKGAELLTVELGIHALVIHSILSAAARSTARWTFSLFIPAKHPHKYRVSTTDTFSYRYCRGRTIH